MGFTFRPIFASLTGAIGFYYVPNVEEFYVEGLAVQFWFALFYVIGYLAGVVVFNRKLGSHSKNCERSLLERNEFSVVLFSLFLGLASVVAMHVLSAGRWLAHVRSEAITAAVPLGKLLFPLAVVPLSVAVAYAILLIFLERNTRRRMLGLLSFLLASAFLTLLYQRGFLISAFLLSFALLERYRRIRMWWVFGLMAFVLFYALYARPLIAWLLQGQALIFSWESILHRLFMSPDLDKIDVWPIALRYVEENGFLWGYTLIYAPAALLAPSQRLELGWLTVVDLLNAYYWGPQYWDTRFGFNVTLAQELFLNFSWLGLVGAYLAGIGTFFADRFLLRRGVTLGFVAFNLGAFNVYSGGYFVWPLAYLFYYLAIRTLFRGRWWLSK